MRDILLIAVVTASLPICLFRPAFGIVVWTLLGFLNPQAFTFGAARHAPLAQAVAIATLAGFLLRPSFKRLFCAEMFLLGALWLWFTLTTIASDSTPILAEKSADCWYRWGFVSKILLMTVVSVGIVNSRALLRWLLLAIGGSFALLVFHTLPGIILSGGNFRIYGPENSMVADNTAFGLALDMALPFFFYLAKTESDRRLKWFFGLAFIAGIPAIFFTYSRGAFVGLIAVAMFMFLQSNQKMVLSLIAIVALIFGAFLAPQKFRDRVGETTNTSESSAASRLNEWAYSWNVAKAYPVTGGGFEAFTPALYHQYAPDPRDVHGPHSIYFGIILEHGFVGFILYFSLVGYCFFALHWIAKQARLRGDEEAIDYAQLLRFSLIGFLGAGAFLGRTYFDFYFMIVACTAILRQVCREEWAANDSEEEGADDADTSLSRHAYV